MKLHMFTNLDTGGYGHDPVRINTHKKFLLVIFRVREKIDIGKSLICGGGGVGGFWRSGLGGEWTWLFGSPVVRPNTKTLYPLVINTDFEKLS